MSQPVEIDIGAAIDGDQVLATHPAARDILLQSCDRQRSRRLCDAAGIVENILDRPANFIGADSNDIVHPTARDFERFLAYLRHRHAVGKQVEGFVTQLNAPVSSPRGRQARRAFRLHTDHPNLRAQVFHIGGDARDEPATAHRHEDRVNRTSMLVDDLHSHGPLAGNHVGVVVGMDEHVAVLLRELVGVDRGFVIAVATQQHLGTQIFHRVDLDLRGVAAHDDVRGDSQFPRRQGNTLGMVARGCRDDPEGAFRIRQLRHLVVGPTNLE